MESYTEVTEDQSTSMKEKLKTNIKKENLEEDEDEEEEEMELEVEVKGIVVKSDLVDEASSDSFQVTSSSSPSLSGESDANKANKICGVCDQTAKSSHFGAICCDSCKAFFRRSVQSGVWETFLCFKDGQCDMRENRRCCQACRFKRCRKIGMDTSLVMTEEERKALMSRKLERRRQLVQEHMRFSTLAQQSVSDYQQQDLSQNCHTTENDCSDPSSKKDLDEINPSSDDSKDDCLVIEILNREDKATILFLQKLLRKSLAFPEFPKHYYDEKADIIEHLFFIFCKCMGKFFSFTPEFRELDINDQKTLLKPAVAKAIFIFGTHQYEPSRECWPRRLLTPSCTFPTIVMSAVEKFIDDEDTVCKWKTFIEKFTSFYNDEVIMILSLMVALFDNADTKLVGHLEIGNKKAKYVQLLEDYVQQYYSTISMSTVTSHLWESLKDVQELTECFEKSSTKDKELNNSSSHESLNFSSSLGEGARLPPKKALHKRNTDEFTERENQEIVILKDFGTPQKAKTIIKSEMESHFPQPRYRNTERERFAVNARIGTPEDAYMSPVLDHNYQNIPEFQSRDTLAYEERLGTPGIIRTKELIIRPLPQGISPYQSHRNEQEKSDSTSRKILKNSSAVIMPISQRLTDSRRMPPYVDHHLQQQDLSSRKTPEVLHRQHKTSVNVADLRLPSADQQQQRLTPSQAELLHCLGIKGDSILHHRAESRENRKSSFQQKQYSDYQNYSRVTQEESRGIPVDQMPSTSLTSSNIDKSRSLSYSSDEDLLNAIQNALPPHLMKHLAKKFGSNS